ncbi:MULTISPECIES: hypothetical protein [unclassified Nonomuraea]|uniref:hypothetical protein n=1 Tax=unclassified Nonomuraea TaxID=2593643 RepID=UPI00191BE984|nr:MULTISPECIES: hypothetical protein [unclassified Nonomuraea]
MSARERGRPKVFDDDISDAGLQPLLGAGPAVWCPSGGRLGELGGRSLWMVYEGGKDLGRARAQLRPSGVVQSTWWMSGTGTGCRIAADDIVLNNPAKMKVERYRYRGAQISTPYNIDEVDPKGARFRKTHHDDVGFVGQVSEYLA